ncbi:L-asparaginase, putative [Hondaea fermentalgiana]|uniref:asparaginase n=1 Tax=Hondaea fermentalgiana TaxID=2315210 RepID=A0A2R5G1I7_9STRA|nr:L-asparaginase, putative [Hondaea fermentalgiana]|eukprot:GBG24870.1 L-asparaginase, putative [Hondaea fermentalgiana]
MSGVVIRAGAAREDTADEVNSEKVEGVEEEQTANMGPKVLVLYIGGTIGMVADSLGSLKPCPGYLTKELTTMPEMTADDMPNVDVKEYDTLVDSSDMDASDWAAIVRDIEDNYFNYDGFVVLQGTDTMAYSASALSFMLENLGKPVVLTGSMIPLIKGYSDARRNLLMAIFIAGTSCIPEVCIFFFDKLLRGNRSKKLDTGSLDAFQSPNFGPLASVGVGIQYHESFHLDPPKKPFRTHKTMDRGVAAIRMIPGFDDEILRALKNVSSLKAIVVELYGTGNAPSRKRGLVEALESLIAAGKLVVVVSQCPTGNVDLLAYAVGRRLAEAGCLSGHDMTVEAVAAKLSYLFGRGLSPAIVRDRLSVSLRGELTTSSERRAPRLTSPL